MIVGRSLAGGRRPVAEAKRWQIANVEQDGSFRGGLSGSMFQRPLKRHPTVGLQLSTYENDSVAAMQLSFSEYNKLYP